MSATDPFEWGVLHTRTGEVHRSRMDEQGAREWLAEWLSDGGRPDAFELIRRPVGEWQEVR